MLSVEEFQALAEALEDYQDLQNLRIAKYEEGLADTVALDAIVEDLESGGKGPGSIKFPANEKVA